MEVFLHRARGNEIDITPVLRVTPCNLCVTPCPLDFAQAKIKPWSSGTVAHAAIPSTGGNDGLPRIMSDAFSAIIIVEL